MQKRPRRTSTPRDLTSAGVVPSFVGKDSFWNVKSTGDVFADTDTGHRLARELLDMGSAGNPYLGWAVCDMPRGEAFGLVEIAFLECILDAAQTAWAMPDARPGLDARDAQWAFFKS